jgi:hypothetical protein
MQQLTGFNGFQVLKSMSGFAHMVDDRPKVFRSEWRKPSSNVGVYELRIDFLALECPSRLVGSLHTRTEQIRTKLVKLGRDRSAFKHEEGELTTE